jgi:hypothetical protein
MEHNPYAPPEAQEISFLREEPPPRPIAVWLFLVVISMFIIFLVANTAQLLWAVLSYREGIRSIAGLAMAVAWQLFVVAVFLFAAIGAYRGTPWSRWLGVVAIMGFIAVLFLRPDTTRYVNDAQRAGGYVGRMFIWPLLLVWWAYAFAFSSKARRYFSRRET